MSGPFGAGALQLYGSAGDFYSHTIDQSLRFEDGDNPYLTKTFSSSGGTIWTFSCWVKFCNSTNSKILLQGYSSGTNYTQIPIYSSGTTGQIGMYSAVGGSAKLFAYTTGHFVDPTAWYHVVVKFNGTSGSEEFKVYINGENQDITTSTALTAHQSFIGNNNAHYIGNNFNQSSDMDGYMAEVNFIDGTALDADSFGQTKGGIWIPKEYSGSYGTNGFYLPFKSSVTATGQSTVLYKGTGATRSVEGMGYKPDLLWIKDRTTAYDHHLIDRVRGGSNSLYSNDSVVENTYATNVAFASKGFTIPNGSGVPNIYLNKSSDDFIAWAWDAGADQTATGYGCALYRGSGAIRPVTDIGFSPDLIWIKERTGAANNRLFDSVRGPGINLISNSSSSEGTDNNTQISFDSDGFRLGSNSQVNNSGDDFVAWCWDAGDSAPASNTDGSITSTVKASTANGFSIVTYTGNLSSTTTSTGASVGHGLSSPPDLIITKRRTGSFDWDVRSSALTSFEYRLNLNSTDDTDDLTAYPTNSPTSSVFYTNYVSTQNVSGEDYVSYCWHSVSGYSKIGTYTGNGSATGPTVTCGFRPAFVMIKRVDSTGSWYIFDVNRDPDNKGQRYLRPNSDAAEGGSGTGTEYIDFQSNGFQIIASGTDFGDGNTSSATYLYMAFAGGLDTIAPVNTDGSTTSRVKASDDTGFSIVQYEGTGSNATVGHGLSSAPDWIVVKNRSFATNWTVYHSANTGSPAGQYLSLNLTNATASGSGVVWNSTAPTSSVFSLGTGNAVNRSGDEFIAYCWTATTGKSAFGSYTGTGSSGKAITGLGFKPALVIIKSYDQTRNWVIVDDKRGGSVGHLHPSSTVAEQTGEDEVQFDSDGFTLLSGDADSNYSSFNYIYMAFADGQDASFFHDESGNDNNFNPSGVQNYDVVPDSPINSFCTLNPLFTNGGATQNFAEGNLKFTADSNYSLANGTFAMRSGKWYWETLIKTWVSVPGIGITQGTNTGGNSYVGYDPNGNVKGFGYDTGGYIYGAAGDGTAAGANLASGQTSFTTGDIMGCSFDADAGELKFYKNNTLIYTVSSINEHDWMPATSAYNGGVNIVNFGQDSSFAGTVTAQGNTDDNGIGDFYYSPPSGFLTLCTANLPDPAIDPTKNKESADYFNTVLYTGTGTTDQSVTGVGFQPDFTWIKSRSDTYAHWLNDVVRGAGKGLRTDSTDAENTSLPIFLSFDSDGFTVDVDSGTANNTTNGSGSTFVAWNWLAGGTASSNTDGSITSSVSANTEAGFSICSFTSNGSASVVDIGHGLDSTPEMVIWKNRDATSYWFVYHKDLTSTQYYLQLHDTAAEYNAATAFFSVSGTTMGIRQSSLAVNGNDCIAYAFHSVDGYSKVGSYTGNGSSDGTFVYTGFRPAWVLVKVTSVANRWVLFDSARSPNNPVEEKHELNPDDATTEGTSGTDCFDFLSNGFKLRRTGDVFNTSGYNYIYLAFAEQPFKYSNAR